MKSIFEPEISRVAHGLEGKTILLYGTNNVGKTLQAVRASKPFIFACENGLGAINNVKYQRITRWLEFKTCVSEFTDESTFARAREMYDTIIIDEVYASSLFCQKFICDTYGDGCISFGAFNNPKVNLYSIYERLYWEQINKLVGCGFTVIFIAHEEEKDDFIYPKGDKRCLKPIIDNCDVVAYLKPNGVDEKGNVIKSSAYFAQTDKFFARSRYDHMVTSIDTFTIENLEKAISDAIAKQEEVDGIKSVDYSEIQKQNANEELDYNTLCDQLQEWGAKLANAGYMDRLTEIVENILGVGKKVSECTKKQTEAMAMVLNDIKKACGELNIE